MIPPALRLVRHCYGDWEVRECGPKALKECRQEFVQEGRSRTERLWSVVLTDAVSLLQEGGSWALSLGHPAYSRPKGTEDQSMPEKRETGRSANRGPARPAWQGQSWIA